MADKLSTSAQDEITILLAEYATLRDELLQRNTMLNQMFAIAGTIGTAVVGLAVTSLWAVSIVLLLASPIPLVFFATMLRFDTYAAGTRIREIEVAINEIAGRRLLVWETDHGRQVVGILDRIRWTLSGN